MRYLIIRLTSLGSVAMSVPLISSLSRRYTDDEFVYVARKDLADLFHGMPNVRYVRFTPSHNSSSLTRSGELCAMVSGLHAIRRFDAVVDLQGDTTTFLTRCWCLTHGVKSYCISRTDALHRWAYIQRSGKASQPPAMADSYAAALRSAGFTIDDDFTALDINTQAAEFINERFGNGVGERWIGIAPFAKSATNTLPFRTTKGIIQYFSEQPNTRVFLFGAGVVESEMLNQWSSIYDNVVSVAGMLSLGSELELMRRLSGMICMDSANQHLASLVALKVITIWGGTTPENGFLAWKQDKDMCLVPRRNIPCRPCALNGNNKCAKKTYECLGLYSVAQILQHYNEAYNLPK